MSGIKIAEKLLPFLRFYPWAIPALIILGVLASLAEGIGIGLFIPFLETVGQVGESVDSESRLVRWFNSLFAVIPPERRLLLISAAIFGSILLKALLSFITTVLFAWLETRVGHRLRSGLFDQLLSVDYHFLQKNESGDLWNALSTETWRASQALSVLINLVITVCTLAVYIVLLLLISWQLTLLVAAAMVFISLLVRLLTRQVEGLGQRATQANATLAQRMLEGFSGMKVIRAFGREVYEQQRFDRVSKNVSDVFLKLGMLSGVVSPVYEVFAAALLVTILLLTLQNPSNLPSLLVFMFVLYRLQPKVKALDGARLSLASLAAGVEKVTYLLDRSDKPYLLSEGIAYGGFDEAITFENVTFYYDPEGEPALRDVSLRIPAGQTTALVGPSGAGKSTLINLIFRFYEATEGEIYIDDHPLRTLDPATWRSRIALVSQDVYIFNTTVRENIAYGRLSASDDDIIAAARQADAHTFICQLPRGYDTLVGDRGVRLSGGQQQRLTLARAIVRNPEILILDEATNALDSISENLIQEALDKLRQNRTVIVIAHRLSTTEQADHIIVLDGGRVREQGDLHHLLKLNGLFARLYHLQHRRSV